MLRELVKLANLLDDKGLHSEASELDAVITKIAEDQHGIFQHFQSSLLTYDNRENYLVDRSSQPQDRENLYGVFPEQSSADNTLEEPAPSLSTRYSPDRVGVQARRIGDGVYQDPYTNKIYDYNEGFKREDGETFSGGAVDNQTKLHPM